MFTENGVMIDMDELRMVVENADVFTIGFRTFPERLIVDTRAAPDEGPMVELVDPVGTVEERFHWLGRRRSSFNVPERFTFFIWPHSVRYLEESGVTDQIRRRVQADADEATGRTVVNSMRKLRLLEYKSERDAITGRTYETIWQRPE